MICHIFPLAKRDHVCKYDPSTMSHIRHHSRAPADSASCKHLVLTTLS